MTTTYFDDTTGRVINVTPSTPLPTTGGGGGGGGTADITQVGGTAVKAIPAALGQFAFTLYDSAGNEIVAASVVQVNTEGQKATYSANATAIAAAASATDIFTLTGSATKIIRVVRIGVSGIATAAVSAVVQISLRSTANTGGTSANLVEVPHDSQSAAASATALSYSANPTTGTLVGNIRSAYLGLTGTSGVVGGAVQEWVFSTANDQAIVLRGTGQVIAINLNGVTITGGAFNCWVEWTEE